jgi:broad specificity phosphatase PhoE
MAKILLVRHGHVDGIAPERFRGRTDLPLTSRGLAEARAVAERIAAGWRPVRVYTSPLARCVATGAAIAAACEAPTEAIRNLIDIDYGAWQSRSCAEIEAREPKLYAVWQTTPHLVRFPDGDSLQDLAARAADALRLLLARHAGDTVVVVAHDSVNRVLLMQLIDQPLSAYWRLAQTPCCLNEIDVIEGRVQVLRINETHHLAGIAAV